jgi:catechol 2,3-dioxygenase-like lactoylglutathione lyase family enzyme
MIDHVSIPVSDLPRAAAFYKKLLGALGHAKLVTRETTTGFGKSYPEFWLNLRQGACGFGKSRRPARRGCCRRGGLS